MKPRTKKTDARQFEFPGFGHESLCEALRLAHWLRVFTWGERGGV
jgi:hypothetical protein